MYKFSEVRNKVTCALRRKGTAAEQPLVLTSFPGAILVLGTLLGA